MVSILFEGLNMHEDVHEELRIAIQAKDEAEVERLLLQINNTSSAVEEPENDQDASAEMGDDVDSIVTASSAGKIPSFEVLKDFDDGVLLACEKGTPEIVAMLIKAGAPFSTVDKDGNTPLHRVARGDFENSAQLAHIFVHTVALLPIKHNKQGQTPVDCAIIGKNKLVLATLVIAMGFDEQQIDTALHNNTEAFEILCFGYYIKHRKYIGEYIDYDGQLSVREEMVAIFEKINAGIKKSFGYLKVQADQKPQSIFEVLDQWIASIGDYDYLVPAQLNILKATMELTEQQKHEQFEPHVVALLDWFFNPFAVEMAIRDKQQEAKSSSDVGRRLTLAALHTHNMLNPKVPATAR